jgi:hypothetical protein
MAESGRSHVGHGGLALLSSGGRTAGSARPAGYAVDRRADGIGELFQNPKRTGWKPIPYGF